LSQQKKEPKKYICSVYHDPLKRYAKDGCFNSWKVGVKFDTFPGSKNKPVYGQYGKTIMFWDPKECSDGKWRPLGIEECTYIWNEELDEYEGDCEECGKCCMGSEKNDNKWCKYLIEKK
jgi:hypothetical protein